MCAQVNPRSSYQRAAGTRKCTTASALASAPCRTLTEMGWSVGTRALDGAVAVQWGQHPQRVPGADRVVDAALGLDAKWRWARRERVGERDRAGAIEDGRVRRLERVGLAGR